MRTILLLIICLLNCQHILAGSNDLYLSASGNDRALGTKESPLSTLSEAVKRIYKMPGTDTLTVHIASGNYFMQEALRIDKAFSRPVLFKGMDATDKPQFIGGVVISQWESCGGALWKAYIPEVRRFGYSFEQFYVNGKRATRARTPNTGWFAVKAGKEHAYDKAGRTSRFATQQITVDTLDLAHMRGMSDTEFREVTVMFYHKWDVTRRQADFVSLDSGVIHINGQGMKPWNPVGQGSRYVMENYRKALDVPGEWFLDRESGWLYYMAHDDEDMTKATCHAPTLNHFVVINGEVDNPIRDLSFDNIAFRVASYKIPRGGNNPMQAAAYIEAAIEVDRAEKITFRDCEVTNTGAYAIWLREEVHNCTIERCLLEDLGAGGIKVGEPHLRENHRPVSHTNVINNNIIRQAGYVFPCGVGVAILHSSDNRVTHNAIYDLRYSGISVGWMWGYKDTGMWITFMNDQGESYLKFGNWTSPAVRNTVSQNHIHHIGWGELSDMGAVYTLGESPGTVISNNVIHDVYSYDYGGWGLYTDEGSTGIRMSNNLVWGCKSGGFHQHYGRDNIIENNIFAFGLHCQLQFTRVEEHQSFSFKHNIILQDIGVNLAGNWKDAKIDMDYNCWFDLRGIASKFGNNLTWDEWRKLKDQHSLNTDPLFIDPLNLDFRFKSNRVTRKIGFIPFDYSKAGVYGSEAWIQKSKIADDVHRKFVEIIVECEKEVSSIYR